MFVRKIAVFLAVLVTAFLSGWSALDLGGGILLAAALGAGVAFPIFHNGERAGTCGRTMQRRLTR